ncbi:hypothetical protein [Helicobacter kayseriensis]|uniref:hypothetical protein n=1 Tax=Helicobacter kayseriensis TaxID=2905877 RepID=UPI001E566B55|nr:hypothetical protein [Helicobacter kayseriensis]MCE3047677.1 hypothetical protein [Helicobacter kayseriensis]MCE3049085.1 hypothetical protein [Helicobacter kayseriensis]
MQNNFIFFFYLLAFLLYIPTLILGTFLKPPTKKQISPPTPQSILARIKKGSKYTKQALEDFEKLFLNAQSCDQTLWLEIIKEFALSPSLEIKEITSLQEKLKQNNPNLQNEIALTISVAIKERK